MSSHQTWQVLGLALGYPDPEVQRAVPELLEVLQRERLLAPRALTALSDWLRTLAQLPLLDAQERYSATFDGGRFLSLHLFEHVYGDHAERGRALAELSRRYHELGFAIDPCETPDYLPAMCELAGRSGADGVAILAEARPVVDRLCRGLSERNSTYLPVVEALLAALGAAPGDAVAEASTAAAKSPPLPNLEQLDREWEEAPVEFGVGAAHDSLVPLRRSRDSKNLPLTSP